MIDHPAPSPLIGCRVRVPSREEGSFLPARPECEGIVECIDVNTHAVVRLGDGTAHTIHPSALTVLDMPRYRANLERRREPDEWEVVEANLRWGTPDEDHEGEPYAGTIPVGLWRAVSHRAEQDGVWVLWERPLRRV